MRWLVLARMDMDESEGDFKLNGCSSVIFLKKPEHRLTMC